MEIRPFAGYRCRRFVIFLLSASATLVPLCLFACVGVLRKASPTSSREDNSVMLQSEVQVEKHSSELEKMEEQATLLWQEVQSQHFLKPYLFLPHIHVFPILHRSSAVFLCELYKITSFRFSFVSRVHLIHTLQSRSAATQDLFTFPMKHFYSIQWNTCILMLSRGTG